METSEILSAFVDGEVVDHETLAAALAAPGAREALIDFVRLRVALAGDRARPSEDFVRAMRTRLGGGGARPGRAALRVLRLAAAVVTTALAAVGAYDLARGVRPEPADEAPAPTRVIRFEPGVDWGPFETGPAAAVDRGGVDGPTRGRQR